MDRTSAPGRFQHRGRVNFRGPPPPFFRGGRDGRWRGGPPPPGRNVGPGGRPIMRARQDPMPFRGPPPMHGGRPMHPYNPPPQRGGPGRRPPMRPGIPPPPPMALHGRHGQLPHPGRHPGRPPIGPPHQGRGVMPPRGPFRPPHAGRGPMLSPPPPPPSPLLASPPPPLALHAPRAAASPHHTGAVSNALSLAQQQNAPVPATSAASNVTVWSEFTSPAGVKYYFNAVTKVSTYDKPAGFLGSQDDAPKKPSRWAEYTDGATGKKYYSDGVTTTWEKPSSHDAQQAPTEDDPAKGAEPPPRKKAKAAKRENEFGSKEEAIASFKGFLIAKDVPPTMKWHELVKAYASEPRWLVCENALTTGERKQALAEYETKRTNELRQMDRQERLRAREVFMELLSESLPKQSSFSAWNTRFEDIRDSLARDDRFHAVSTEESRESFFLDFCEEYRKREERKKRSKRKEAQDAFVSFLSEQTSNGLLSFASTWNSFVSSLSDAERNDPRFVPSILLSESDRQLNFADYVISLQTAEDDKRRRIQDARRRAEQAQRDEFVALLSEIAQQSGKLVPWSRWKDVEESIANERRHLTLREQSPDAPRKVFEEFIGDWNFRYRKDRMTLRSLMKPTAHTELVVNEDTSYEAFSKALLESASSSSSLFEQARAIINETEPVCNAKIFFKELQGNVRSRTISHRGSSLRRGQYDSSEDEGEIVEDDTKPARSKTSQNEGTEVTAGTPSGKPEDTAESEAAPADRAVD